RKHFTKVLIETMRPSDMTELASRFVVVVDDAAVGARQLDGSTHDGVENRLQVQRGADGAANFTERFQFLDRARQLARTGLELGEQTYVLDRDDRLVREGCRQLDLLISEGPSLVSQQGEDSDKRALPHHRDRQHGAKATSLLSLGHLVFRIRQGIGDVNRSPLQGGPSSARPASKAQLDFPPERS